MKRTYRILAEEFALSNFQLQMGRPRAEVLHELGARTGVSDLRALGRGADPGRQVRLERRPGACARRATRCASAGVNLAEEKAAKTAVQLIFPLVLFIFPGHLRDPGRPGRHHHGPPDVSHDGRIGRKNPVDQRFSPRWGRDLCLPQRTPHLGQTGTSAPPDTRLPNSAALSEMRNSSRDGSRLLPNWLLLKHLRRFSSICRQNISPCRRQIFTAGHDF